MSIVKNIDHFSIEQICESGQCFRMNRLNNGKYEVIAGSRYLTVSQDKSIVTFYCSEDDYNSFWQHYFDIGSDTDYGKIKEAVDKDDLYLQNAMKYGYGIRILNQDLWEMMISFIISQRNNIKRIKTCIKRLCEKFGERHVICDSHDSAGSSGNTYGSNDYNGSNSSNNANDYDSGNETVYYSFPTPEALYNADIDEIKACGVGYRDAYIKKAAEAVFTGEFDLNALLSMDYTSAKCELLKLFGVGNKVADCICLFALHKTEAFPMDTHMISIVNNEYGGHFPIEQYYDFAGILQQYMFYYDLKL